MSKRKTGLFAELDRKAKAERAAKRRVRDAAPELLEACLDVVHWMDADVSGSVDCAMGARAMERVRAAIKKATGK